MTAPAAAALLARRAFLFDLDGTLLDSSPTHAEGFVEALRSLQPALLEGFDYERIKGMPTRESLLHLGVAPGPLLDALVQAKGEHYRRAFAAGRVRLFPAALQLLRLLRGRLRGVVTSSRGEWVRELARRTGLAEELDGLVTADDVPAPKPDPAPWLLALRRHGLRAHDAVAVEDGLAGVRSALAAGLFVLQVNGPAVDPAVPAFPTVEALLKHLHGASADGGGV